MPAKEKQMRLMTNNKRSKIALGGVIVLASLLMLTAMALTGCADPGSITAVEPTATLYPPTPTDIPLPPPGPTPEALDFPLAAPAREEEKAEPVNDQTCVDCHTDEETLKAVATEEEGEESLSEGEG
jgi:hypothetical protein